LQALAATVAAQRASVTRVAPPVPPRPAPLRDVAPRPASPTLAQAAPARPAPIQQAAVEAPARRAVPPATPAPAQAVPTFVSALGGGSSLGRPMLAPPVPISSAVAATLDGRRDLLPPQAR
jgi:hypothetical protein